MDCGTPKRNSLEIGTVASRRLVLNKVLDELLIRLEPCS
jgi:hypothetical protein